MNARILSRMNTRLQTQRYGMLFSVNENVRCKIGVANGFTSQVGKSHKWFHFPILSLYPIFREFVTDMISNLFEGCVIQI